ncbi:hypothetical protein HY500_02290 [Candidatus Woesearchaeota archaeon]|nr:hypothetical protein [Candidatus Woesearchaeota archaeon]
MQKRGLIIGLIIFIFLLLPIVYGQESAEEFLDKCLSDAKSSVNVCGSVDEIISACKSQLDQKSQEVSKVKIDCRQTCANTYFGDPYNPGYSDCLNLCSSDAGKWFGNEHDNLDPDGEFIYWDSNSRDYEISLTDDFRSSCESSQTAQTTVADELQLVEDEIKQFDADRESIKDEMTELCKSVEGCKPGDRESPDFGDNIINDIIKIHSDSCLKGKCISMPITKATEILDRITDYNERVDSFNDKMGDSLSENSNLEAKLSITPFITLWDELKKGEENQQAKNQQTAVQTWQGEKRGDEFAAIPENAVHVSAEQDANLNENEFYTQLNELLSGKGKELSSEQVASAIKSYHAKLSAEQGQSVSIDLPKDSPVQSVVMVTTRQIQDAAITVTTIDEDALNKAVPLLAGKGVIGNPDYPTPILPLVPPTEQYTLKSYFKLDAKLADSSLPYYKEVFFNFVTRGTEAEAPRTKVLHYDENKKDWGPLPTQYYLVHDAYGRSRFTTHVPSFSYFAIVVEKEEKKANHGESYLIAAIIFGILTGFAIVRFRYQKAVKGDSNKEKIEGNSQKSKGNDIKVDANLKTIESDNTKNDAMVRKSLPSKKKKTDVTKE